jgi:hypothetical protein
MQAEHQFLERDRIALRWYDEELRPAVELLRDAGLVRREETDVDAYFRLTCERYRLMRTQVWSDEALDRVRARR